MLFAGPRSTRESETTIIHMNSSELSSICTKMSHKMSSERFCHRVGPSRTEKERTSDAGKQDTK